MKPQKQLLATDCLRACLASLLHYRIDSVPNFVDAPEIDGDSYPAWWLALQSWLNDLGLYYVEIALVENFPWQPLPIPAMCILLGTTAKGFKHAVVGKLEDDKFMPVFNPHPNPESARLVSVDGIGLLVPRDPVTYVRMGHGLESIKKMSGAISLHPLLGEIHSVAMSSLQENEPSIISKVEKNGSDEPKS